MSNKSKSELFEVIKTKNGYGVLDKKQNYLKIDRMDFERANHYRKVLLKLYV